MYNDKKLIMKLVKINDLIHLWGKLAVRLVQMLQWKCGRAPSCLKMKSSLSSCNCGITHGCNRYRAETSVASLQLTQFWQIPRQNAFISPDLTMLLHYCVLAVKPTSSPWHLLPKQTSRDSLRTYVFLSAVSLLVVALLSLEFLGGLRN